MSRIAFVHTVLLAKPFEKWAHSVIMLVSHFSLNLPRHTFNSTVYTSYLSVFPDMYEYVCHNAT